MTAVLAAAPQQLEMRFTEKENRYRAQRIKQRKIPIAHGFRLAREMVGVTQLEASLASGQGKGHIGVTTISLTESWATTPHNRTVRNFAHALGIRVSELHTLIEQQNEERLQWQQQQAIPHHATAQ